MTPRIALLCVLSCAGCDLQLWGDDPTDGKPGDAGETVAVLPSEICNGLDDDLDGQVDESALCDAMCTDEAIQAEIDSAHVPNGMQTGGEVLSAMSSVPAWCSGAGSAPEDTVTIACGEILTVQGGMIEANLYIAAGGVLRVDGDTALYIEDTLLVCPGGLVQGSGAPAFGPAGDGADLVIEAASILNWGVIDTSGGASFDANLGVAGDAGAITLLADRLLHDGALFSRGASRQDGTGDLSGGDGAGIYVEATTESYLAGCIVAQAGMSGFDVDAEEWGESGAPGSITLIVPVCCADVDEPEECG